MEERDNTLAQQSADDLAHKQSTVCEHTIELSKQLSAFLAFAAADSIEEDTELLQRIVCVHKQTTECESGGEWRSLLCTDWE